MEAIIYGAKSTDDRKGSIPDQLRQCREMAEREGWVVRVVYEDEGFSAYSGDRGPGLKAALANAAELAAETGEVVMLIAQHSDRISRGAGDKPGAPRALVEIWHELRRQNVHLRSVQDDDDLRDSASVASKGKRNHDDSKRKGDSTKDGIRREVERGVWRGGTTPDGYEVEVELDERGRQQLNEYGRPIRRLVKDPKRSDVYDLIWSLARERKSALTLGLELSRRGYMTQPRVRRDRGPSKRSDRSGPRPFDADRITQILNSPVYAGLQVHQGMTFPGDWEPFVDVETFYRLKADRAKHSSPARRGAHRPPEGFLLLGVARCGLCETSAIAVTGKPRKDGTGRKQYLCPAHRKYHRDSEHWCPAKPWDAVEVDRRVLAGIEDLMLDADALRRQMVAGQNAERDKRDAEVARAREEEAEAEKRAERAEADYAATDDDTERGIALRAAKAARLEAEKAARLMDAALDAREQEHEADPEEAMARLWEALGGQLSGATGDIKLVNAALRENFDAFVLHRDHVSARVSGAALWRHAQRAVNAPPYKLYPDPAPLFLA